MIKSTQITRLDGVPLAASVDEASDEASLSSIKASAKALLRRLSASSEPRASIESGEFTLHYLIASSIIYMCICERSYPRKLAFTYLSDIASEFETMYGGEAHAAGLRPYAFVQFDTFMQRTKRTYQDTRATRNLDRLNDDLKDVTRVMTKNIEDLLYRGDSLERMGDMSERLRDESRKYRQAAVRINWELLLKQYGPVGGFAFIMLVFIWWRFF
ncbi:Longin-like domain-containing protein [Sphaerosporella brunnea]|uniref:Protein transport protein SEC22 n=1 Tax=Sphaerosporella brunnea TaxID=1250544 RepID=A0A5J5F4C0_9PEZI|nr:Longin-like domain-containing protein [Sphaerosporella brunnea]